MLVNPVAVREQRNASVVGEKAVANARSHAQGPRHIKYVHLDTYLTVIKHVRERAFFCNSSKARTPVDLHVRR